MKRVAKRADGARDTSESLNSAGAARSLVVEGLGVSRVQSHLSTKPLSYARFAVRSLVTVIGIGVASYAAYFVTSWIRYGRPKSSTPSGESDSLLESFMPVYEVAECHEVPVTAPAEITFSAATELHLTQSAVVRSIFKTRELILGGTPKRLEPTRTLLAEMRALGWGVLAEIPGREVVVGAVTRPWEPNVVFRALSATEFVAFHEPDYVKIAWTLRADPTGPGRSVCRTETRVATTDSRSRVKFRLYWSLFSPGIILIRKMWLRLVKKEAERRRPRSAPGLIAPDLYPY